VACGLVDSLLWGWLSSRAGLAGWGQVVTAQVPSRRVRPRRVGLRRLTAAVRRLSQAWFGEAGHMLCVTAHVVGTKCVGRER
jgi:hypothetical protein